MPPSEKSGPLQSVDRDLWIVDGPAVDFLRIPYPTRMAVARLRDGGLWVWSPTALDDELAAAVRDLGRVRHLVPPNKLHHLFLPDWVERFPEAKLWAPPGLAAKRPDLDFHAELGDQAPAQWAEDIDQVLFAGSLFMDEVVFFHRASRTALFCDLIQKFDPASLRGWRRWIMRLDGMLGPDGSTPREWRASFLRRGPARAARAQALAWDPERLVIAHGEWVRENGRERLARSLRWLGA